MNERTIASRRVFDGRLLKIDVLEVELDSGRRAVREIVRHPGATVILAERPDGRFAFVRQFRKAAEAVLLETVAGTLDPGETPETCARREVTEETGHAVRTITPLGTAYPAPGYTEERLHFFHATVNEQAGDTNPDEDEELEVVYLSPAEIDELIARGELVDAKTLIVWMLYARRRAP